MGLLYIFHLELFAPRDASGYQKWYTRVSFRNSKAHLRFMPRAHLCLLASVLQAASSRGIPSAEPWDFAGALTKRVSQILSVASR